MLSAEQGTRDPTSRPSRGGTTRRPGDPLSPGAWLAVPWLFAGAVLGVTATFGFLLDADWHALLSAALFGAAAAVTALTAVGDDSWPRGLRPALRILYPAAVLAAGVAIGPVTVPTPVAVAVGLPAFTALVLVCRQGHDRAQCPRKRGVVGPAAPGRPVSTDPTRAAT